MGLDWGIKIETGLVELRLPEYFLKTVVMPEGMSSWVHQLVLSDTFSTCTSISEGI